MKDLYDRVGTVVDESIAGVVRAVRAGADAARRADRDLQRQVEHFAEQVRRLTVHY